MQITWYGHAAFLIEGQNQNNETVRIGLDPYRAPDVGTYAPIDDVADIVVVSHENQKYHSNIAAFRAPDQVEPRIVHGLELLDLPQPQTIFGVPFFAVRVWEDETRAEPIAMIGVEMDNLRVLHMGDVGHRLSAEEIAACGPVDVLLALAGGQPTIAIPDLADFVRALQPSVVIPMHFGNDKINLNLRPVSDLFAALPEMPAQQSTTPTVTITRETLPASTEIRLLPPAR